jgi:hypothetical protein
MKRALVMAISVILALAVAAPIASGKKPPSQPQDVNALTEQWWTWALAVPSPLEGDYKAGRKCKGEFVEGVFFLAGTQGGEATRTCTVPADTALFFPVLNSFITDDEEAYPEGPTNFVDTALANGEFSATLDGEDLEIIRIATGPFTLTVPKPNIFKAPPGPYTAVSDGLWVYLPQGLEPGEYTLQFGGTSVTAEGEPFSLDVTYNLKVV